MKILEVISGLVAASATLFRLMQAIAVVDMVIAVSNFVDLSRKERRFSIGVVISHDGYCMLSLFVEGADINNFDNFDDRDPGLSPCPILTVFIFWLILLIGENP